MELLAAVVLGLFFAGCLVFCGADLGVGMLLPYLGRTHTERRRAIRAIWPLCLLHESWVVATAGLFVGAFPRVESRLFTDLLVVVVVLVAGWVVRDTGLWWTVLGGGAAGDWLVTVGSWSVVSSLGWLLASLLGETPGRSATPASGALTTVFIVLLLLAHGLGLSAMRLSGPSLHRALRLTGGAAGRSFALTSVVTAALALVAGARLPLVDHAAGDRVLGLLLVPALLLLPLLVAAQVRLWRLPADRLPGLGPGPAPAPAPAGPGRPRSRDRPGSPS
ncbi:cytochrome d ubiquinol oxidase subunit II [Streptomyces sp. NPDC058576]|uniref:cytochrome d ubiquinol oxidase subunit II n=1 Tax=Streptomyces sp. NPDC058576 TaxID=3346547 RepID=UPI003669F2C3